MFMQSRVRNGQPVNQAETEFCYCSCHPAFEPKPAAIEARLCRECADERFQSWGALVNVLVRDE